MENIDLNLENYSLDDILDLFKLPYQFTEDHLKQAKRIVYQTHPDKSDLPKEYFLFFCKAYKSVYQIYQFRTQKTKSTEYTTEKDDEKEIILSKIKEKRISTSGLMNHLKKLKLEMNQKKGMEPGFQVMKILINVKLL